MYTVTVSIGRSIPGGGQLTNKAWSDFRFATLIEVERTAKAIYFDGIGLGRWEDGYEDSYTIVAAYYFLSGIATLQTELAKLAAAYSQESIAVTIGQTELIEAATL